MFSIYKQNDVLSLNVVFTICSKHNPFILIGNIILNNENFYFTKQF